MRFKQLLFSPKSFPNNNTKKPSELMSGASDGLKSAGSYFDEHISTNKKCFAARKSFWMIIGFAISNPNISLKGVSLTRYHIITVNSLCQVCFYYVEKRLILSQNGYNSISSGPSLFFLFFSILSFLFFFDELSSQFKSSSDR